MTINKDKTVRKLIAFPRDLWARIADYRFDKRIASEAEAVRQLIEAGLPKGEGVRKRK